MRRRSLALSILLLFLASHAWAAIALTEIRVRNVPIVRAQLLTNAVAITNGEWIDVSGLAAISIDVTGITTATVEIDGSNEMSQPANSTHGRKLNSPDITTDQMVFLSASVRWLKVRMPAWTSGTVNVYFEGRAQQ